jgi:hypothetical protein
MRPEPCNSAARKMQRVGDRGVRHAPSDTFCNPQFGSGQQGQRITGTESPELIGVMRCADEEFLDFANDCCRITDVGQVVVAVDNNQTSIGNRCSQVFPIAQRNEAIACAVHDEGLSAHAGHRRSSVVADICMEECQRCARCGSHPFEVSHPLPGPIGLPMPP